MQWVWYWNSGGFALRLVTVVPSLQCWPWRGSSSLSLPGQQLQANGPLPISPDGNGFCLSLHFYKPGEWGHSDPDKKSCFSGFSGSWLDAGLHSKIICSLASMYSLESLIFSVLWLRKKTLRLLDFGMLVWVWVPEVMAIPAPSARDWKHPAELPPYPWPPPPFKPFCPYSAHILTNMPIGDTWGCKAYGATALWWEKSDSQQNPCRFWTFKGTWQGRTATTYWACRVKFNLHTNEDPEL